MPRLVNAIANEAGGGERFPEAKERLFRTGVSMGEERHWMRSRAGGKKLKRRRLFGECHFLDADTLLNPSGERQTDGEADDGCRGD